MENGFERYQRQLRLEQVGLAGQQKLQQAKILVIGAGGLGSPVLQYLVAAGVGTIGVIDPDKVEVSNLHRQLIFTTKDIGKNKALAAQSNLSDLNPDIEIISYTDSFNYGNARELCGIYDLLIDGSDNFPTRYLVNDACVLEEVPFVHGSIFKFQGQVSVFNYENGPSYRCLFPNPPGRDEVPSCEEAGVMGVVPGLIGNLMANEALKIILGLGEVLSGQVLTFDLLGNSSIKHRIKRNPSEIEKVMAFKENFEQASLELNCEPEKGVPMLSINSASSMEDILFIDLREPHEQPFLEFDGLQKIPYSTFHTAFEILPTSRPVALFCHSGVRSEKAVQFLLENGFSNVYCLKENAPELHLQLSR